MSEACDGRLSCLEELSGMEILCSDKTGTLTLNKCVLCLPCIFVKFSAALCVTGWS